MNISTVKRLEHNDTITAEEFRSGIIEYKYHPRDAIKFVQSKRPDLENTLREALHVAWCKSRLRGMSMRRMDQLLEVYREKGTNVRIRIGAEGNKDPADILTLSNYHRVILEFLVTG